MELKRLRRENADLKRANAIVEAASTFFAAELDRPHHWSWSSSVATRAAAKQAGLVWGVEPICTVLSEHGLPIAPSTYYDHLERLGRAPCRHQVRDERLEADISRVHAAHYGVMGRGRCGCS